MLHQGTCPTPSNDDATAYQGMREFGDESVHSVFEYLRGQAHTNGLDSFRSKLTSGYVDAYSHVWRMLGKRLRYRDLIAENGLPNGTR